MFITFEGPEGSGKSTQVALLADAMRQQGFPVFATREPGGTPIGDQIRACVHNVGHTNMTAVTEMLLYSASRAQLVQEVIRPALATGAVVLCDRYADSTLAYQGYGRQLDLSILQQITAFATGELRPDLTLLLDIDVERGLARRNDGGEEMNRLDLETVAFHRRVRSGYHDLAGRDPQRWRIIDADRCVDDVQQDVQAVVFSFLK